MNELAESFGKPIVQNNGTIVLKKYNNNYNEPYIDNYLDYSYEAQKEVMEILGISKAEFMKVVSQINTLYSGKYKGIFDIEHYTMSYIYKVENHGFHKYIFCDKIPNK